MAELFNAAGWWRMRMAARVLGLIPRERREAEERRTLRLGRDLAARQERQMTYTLKIADDAAASVAIAPRVKLADIKAAIAAVYHVNAFDAVGDAGPRVDELRVLSLCFVVTGNGFIVIGKSAPASPENFNIELGQQLAYEDAIRQLWPLMGFSLRDRMREQHST